MIAAKNRERHKNIRLFLYRICAAGRSAATISLAPTHGRQSAPIEDVEMQPADPVTIALNQINAEISNRLNALRELKEKQLRIEGEVTGLREAQSKFQSAQK
jgi:hypothetical protein